MNGHGINSPFIRPTTTKAPKACFTASRGPSGPLTSGHRLSVTQGTRPQLFTMLRRAAPAAKDGTKTKTITTTNVSIVTNQKQKASFQSVIKPKNKNNYHHLCIDSGKSKTNSFQSLVKPKNKKHQPASVDFDESRRSHSCIRS